MPYLTVAVSFHFQGRNLFNKVLFVFLLFASMAVGALSGLFIVYRSDLPEVRQLEDYRPNVITEVYSDEGQVIGTFALENRVVVGFDQIPRLLQDAIIATEDQHFEQHWGIDFWGIARAAIKDILAWRKAEGASTLTQQLSRLCFLTPEKSFKRKFQEALISIQLERYYTKPQIMTLYCNQVYLGHGTYGFEAASQFFFSKSLKDLKLDEVALLAALPRSPAYYSPIHNPENARMRRNYVLDRMVAEGKVSAADAEAAKKRSIQLNVSTRQNVLAPYFTEEIRKYLERKYGPETVHERGLRVYTTLNVRMQQAANRALADGLEAFDRRHGWRGILVNILKEKLGTLEDYRHEDWKKAPVEGSVITGLVLRSGKRQAQLRFGEFAALIGEPEIRWTGKTSPGQILKAGDLAQFKVLKVDSKSRQLNVELTQVPQVQGALVAIESSSGEVKALIGGLSFEESKFNRATQAFRQTGSAFKPFIYTMALDQGMTPVSTISDTPVSYPNGRGTWSPQNYDHKFEGTISLKRALAQSRNVPAVKLLEKFGVQKGIEYVRKFGITSPNLTPYLPLALGSAEITLMEMTSAYSAFPNDGVRILPRLVKRVTDYDGEVKEENLVEVKEVIPQDTARSMVEMLRAVVENGTAQRAKVLGRPVAGKTGTTNDYTDAWYIGFSPTLTCGVWVGYDQKKSLGKGEVGARVALPIWIDFMREALKEEPVEEFASAPQTPPQTPRIQVDTPDAAPGDGEMPPE
ncbi:MAG: PBP1A family penicillin-binding protein [Acidobacteriota bacterium]